MTISETFENLVLEGGGVRGIAFTGAIKYLEEKNLLRNIKRFAGSSAGAWTATLLTIGLSADEFKELVMETDFRQFQDANTGCGPCSFIKNASRLLWYYSWHKGDLLEKNLGDILEKYTGSRDVTFKQIYEKYDKELIITATNVDKARTIYFHRFSYPDFPVRIAVRASMAIPFYFKPVRFEGEYLVDGGFLNNYPIDIFDDHTYFPCDSTECATSLHEPNPKTLGLKLVGPDERKDELIFHGKLNTSLIRHYTMALMDCMSWQIERSGIKPGYWERTVIIPTFEIKTTDFDLTETDKDRLYNSGYDATMHFLQNVPTETAVVENKPYFLPNINAFGKLHSQALHAQSHCKLNPKSKSNSQRNLKKRTKRKINIKKTH